MTDVPMCRNWLHPRTPENLTSGGKQCRPCLQASNRRNAEWKQLPPDERDKAKAKFAEEQFLHVLHAQLRETEETWNGTPHLVWTGPLNSYGYGSTRDRRVGKSAPVHRLMYEIHIGPIPVGLQIDHLCRVRECAQPDHLEPVTQLENVWRGLNGVLHERPTHCIHGHEYTPENTILRGKRQRLHCRECDRIRKRRDRARRTAAKRAAAA